MCWEFHRENQISLEDICTWWASSPPTATRSSPPPAAACVSADKALIKRARKLSAQARDPAPHYQHSEIGYNYRLSNLLAAVGRGQLQVLSERVRRKREVFQYYADTLGDPSTGSGHRLPGITLMPEAPWGRATRWLTCITVDPQAFGADREAIRVALEDANIESRPLWKPMHLQPVFQDCEAVGGSVAEALCPGWAVPALRHGHDRGGSGAGGGGGAGRWDTETRGHGDGVTRGRGNTGMG